MKPIDGRTVSNLICSACFLHSWCSHLFSISSRRFTLLLIRINLIKAQIHWRFEGRRRRRRGLAIDWAQVMPMLGSARNSINLDQRKMLFRPDSATLHPRSVRSGGKYISTPADANQWGVRERGTKSRRTIPGRWKWKKVRNQQEESKTQRHCSRQIVRRKSGWKREGPLPPFSDKWT